MFAVAAEHGLDPARLGDPSVRVPHSLIVRLWSDLGERTGDETFGLHAAELVSDDSVEIVDCVARASANLGEALGRVIKYERLLHEAYAARLERHGEVTRYIVEFACEPRMPHHCFEFIFGACLLRTRQVLARAPLVKEVAFRHGPPRDVSEHERLLAAPVRFNAEVNEIVFESSSLQIPFARVDSTLSQLLVQQADALLARMPSATESPWVGLVRRDLVAALPQDVPVVGAVARRMGMSERSFQRRLKSEGTSFLALLESTRHTLALQYLEDRSRTLSDVAFLLGFSELAAFVRAFRRWTGTTPGAHRREVAASTDR
jgi:AraC-like DNA-binding protein